MLCNSCLKEINNITYLILRLDYNKNVVEACICQQCFLKMNEILKIN